MKYDIEKFHPCCEAKEFYNNCESSEIAWQNCPRGDWMLWIAYKLKIDKKLLIKAKALCALTVKHLMKYERSIIACEVALKFSEDLATKTELKNAAYAAADADADADADAYAANAADAYAANAAAYAYAADAYASAAAANAAYAAAYAADADAYAAAANAAYAAYAAAAAAAAAAGNTYAFADAAKTQNQKATADICREILTTAIFEKINL